VIALDQDPGSNDEKGAIDKLGQKIDEISLAMEKMGIAQYMEMLDHPWRLLRINFWSGMAIGFTVLAALVVYGLQKIVVLNMPVIGNFIAVIVKIVENQLHPGGNAF
jgi:hypothetical protein